MHVISVAERSRLGVWKHASRAIVERIVAEGYRVIVPRSDIAAFHKNTPASVEVHCENDYTEAFGNYLWESIREVQPQRYGWYLQQLIKLEALRRLGMEGQRGLIWDADTVPLTQLSFFGPRGGAFFWGEERHIPYFRVTETLLGLPSIVERSFIAQSFPCEAHWIAGFCDFVELCHDVPWWQAIIDQTDLREESGFSEYETLGTYVTHFFPGEWSWQKPRWERNGYSAYSRPRSARKDSARGANSPAFVAFESWEPRRKYHKSWLRRLTNGFSTSAD